MGILCSVCSNRSDFGQLRIRASEKHDAFVLQGAVHQLHPQLQTAFLPRALTCSSLFLAENCCRRGIRRRSAYIRFTCSTSACNGRVWLAKDECPYVAPNPSFPCIFTCVGVHAPGLVRMHFHILSFMVA